MPQLDIYIICNMLNSVIIIFIATYMLNISNILIIMNLILRIRKLNLNVNKKYMYEVLKLKQKIVLLNLRFKKYIFCLQYLKLKLINDFFFIEDILDIYTLKKVL